MPAHVTVNVRPMLMTIPGSAPGSLRRISCTTLSHSDWVEAGGGFGRCTVVTARMAGGRPVTFVTISSRSARLGRPWRASMSRTCAEDFGAWSGMSDHARTIAQEVERADSRGPGRVDEARVPDAHRDGDRVVDGAERHGQRSVCTGGTERAEAGVEE